MNEKKMTREEAIKFAKAAKAASKRMGMKLIEIKPTNKKPSWFSK